MITGEILRAARAMARMSQAELATVTRLSLETVKRLERIRGPINANPRTVIALEEALRQAGVSIERRGDGAVGLAPHGHGPAAQAVFDPRTAPPEPAELHRLIYYSAAAAPEDEAIARALEDILRVSLRRNEELGISGCLAAADGRFMQALEGSRASVMQIYGSIAADRRHRDLVVIENRPVSNRRFGDWLMCARAAAGQELACADASQAEGFRPERLSPAAGLGVLAWLADLESREAARSAPAGDRPPTRRG